MIIFASKCISIGIVRRNLVENKQSSIELNFIWVRANDC